MSLSMVGCSGVLSTKHHNQIVPEKSKSNCGVMVCEEKGRETVQGGGSGLNQGENKPDLLQYLPKASLDSASVCQQILESWQGECRPLTYSPSTINALTGFCCSCCLLVNILGDFSVNILNKEILKLFSNAVII